MSKELFFNDEAREKVLKGLQNAAQAISSTLGPQGKNVAIDRKWGSPLVVHDGVTVAKNVDLKDAAENIGAQLIKEAASRTNDAAGDGTTTASILAESIALEAHKNMVAGTNPMAMRRGIEAAVSDITKNLTDIAVPVDSPESVRQVATISAQDPEIGEIVATAINRMGKDAVIAVEESAGSVISIEYKEGMEFDRGFLSSYFITKPEVGEAVVEEPYILITDKRLTSLDEFGPFLESFYPQGQPAKPLVIIADEVSGPALAVLIVNKMKVGIPILAVQSPSFGDNRRALLEDIAVVTGGIFISADSGISLKNVTLEDLGRAKRVASTKGNTIIVDGGGSRETINSRIDSLQLAFDKGESAFDREKLQERIARLTSGIAVINVGANSEVEMREKKERIIDAISATKAALDEGIVPGGETALIRAAQGLTPPSHLSDEESVGYRIVLRAITGPFRKLMENGAFDPGQKLTELYGILSKKNWGIDQMDGAAKDLVKSGIIDPVKVTKSAIKNAASIGIMVMTIDTLIIDDHVQKPSGDTAL